MGSCPVTNIDPLNQYFLSLLPRGFIFGARFRMCGFHKTYIYIYIYIYIYLCVCVCAVKVNYHKSIL